MVLNVGMTSTDERSTESVNATELEPGDEVMGFHFPGASVADRIVATARTDNFGVWVTYTDGIRDSFPLRYKVVVVR